MNKAHLRPRSLYFSGDDDLQTFRHRDPDPTTKDVERQSRLLNLCHKVSDPARAADVEQCFLESVAHEDSTTRGVSEPMPHFSKRPMVLWSFPFLIVLSGCDAKPECDSFETRNAVLQSVSDDHNNGLVKYAAKNSTAAKSSDASSEAETSKQQPLYHLGEKIVTTSTSGDKRTLKCSGAISVTVGETKASKEVNFTVQQSPDGKMSVSVVPFQF